MADILISGAVKPTTTNTPTDARTRVNTFAEIAGIENPAIGMMVYVIDEDSFYIVVKLKSKTIGGIEIPNAEIDMDGGLYNMTERISEIAREISKKTMSESFSYDEENGFLSLDGIPVTDKDNTDGNNGEGI